MTPTAARYIAMLSSILVGMPVGSFYSWSVFILPLQMARPNFATAVSVHADSVVIAGLGVACAITGRLVGKVGPRVWSAVSALVSAAGLAVCAASVFYNVEALMYLGAAANGLGMGGCYVCFIKVFKQHWAHAPGFAAGWVMFVSSAGSFVFVWICESLLVGFGEMAHSTPAMPPAATFLVLAGILLVLQFFGSFLFLEVSSPTPKSKPLLDDDSRKTTELDPAADSSDPGDDGSATTPMTTCAVLATPQFWLVLFVFFASLFPMLGVLTVMVAYLQDRFPEVSSSEAANMLALVNVIGTVTRLFVGFVAVKMGTFMLFAIGLGAQFCIFLVLFWVEPHGALPMWGFVTACVLAKICYGSSFTLVNLLVDAVFGKVNGTQVYGLIIFSLVAAALAAPNVVVLWWTDSSKTIRPYLCVCYGVAAAGLCALLYLRTIRRRLAAE